MTVVPPRILQPWPVHEHVTVRTDDVTIDCVQGLRTLVVGSKVLDANWFADWDERYEAAKGSLNQRDERMAQLALEVELDLNLVGATAIEDKLQVRDACWLVVGLSDCACRRLS